MTMTELLNPKSSELCQYFGLNVNFLFIEATSLLIELHLLFAHKFERRALRNQVVTQVVHLYRGMRHVY